ncbi:MAG: hypothetical protein ACKOWI_05880, partial [Rhodoluna sp.]
MSDVTPTSSINVLRSKLPRLFTKSGPYSSELNEILRLAKLNHPKADLSIIDRAFTVAELAHRTQMRKS